MRRYEERINGERYLGDARGWLVHDLDQETDACGIDQLLDEGWVTPFDSLVDALLDGYDPCGTCQAEVDDAGPVDVRTADGAVGTPP